MRARRPRLLHLLCLSLAGASTLRAQAPREQRLSPLADSIAQYLVFAPVGETWFVASSRNKQLFIDIGRVDTEVRKDSARAAAYRDAVTKRTTVRPNARFRVRGPWGAEDVSGGTVDTWNGRIVIRVSGSRVLDSLARGKATVIASAFRTDSSLPATTDSCTRGLAGGALQARVSAVKDSLERVLRAEPGPPVERLRQRVIAVSSQVAGCFGAARVALVVTLKAGNAEWARERLVLIGEDGKVTGLRVADFRFKAHELLGAFDADGDGVDDLATRASTDRAGATTVLRVDVGSPGTELEFAL